MQIKTIELAAADLEDDSNANLPPLMNPTILEASDDLTNLSHLNEPAGMRPSNCPSTSGTVLTAS